MGQAGVAKKKCAVHGEHRPSINTPEGYTVHAHHIHPLGEGGADHPSNRVYVCPTGHDRIHHLIRVLWKNEGEFPAGYARFFGIKERTLAEKGYRAILRWRTAQGILVDPKATLRDMSGPPELEFRVEKIEVKAVPEEEPEEKPVPDERPLALAAARRRKKLRFADALNRAIRTIWQFIIVDVILTVVPVLMDALEGDDPVKWGSLGRSALRVALGGVVAFVMRYKVPPRDTPPPVDAPGDEGD